MRGSNKYGVVFAIALTVAIVYGANGVVSVNFAYEREVGGHIRNAFEVNTPEAMISELNKSVAGMHALGLVDGMYAAYFLWEQTPDRSMSFQYEYIDQLINRTEAVILWRTLAYNGNSTPETLGDVYEQKMDNLRSFMTEGCSDRLVCTDWIARDVYYVYRATPFYFGWLFGLGAALGLLMSLGLFAYVNLGAMWRAARVRPPLPMEVLTRLRRWVILPLYLLSLVLMGLPFLLGAIRP